MTLASAHVSIAKPLARAPCILPVTNLHLVTRASAHGINIDRTGSTACINAYTVTSMGNIDVVMYVARAIKVIVGFQNEGNHADACVSICPEPRATTTNLRVPLQEVLHRYSILGCNVDACVPIFNKLELVTMASHARLCWYWRLYPVPGVCWRGHVTDYGDTGIGVGPKPSAVISNFRVPSQEVCEGDAILGDNICTSLILFYKVECVAVGDHVRLDRGGSRNACKII